TAPGSVEAEFSRRGVLGGVVRVSVVQGLVFGWGSVVAPGVEPGVVEPVDPFGGGQFDGVVGAPGAAGSDQLGLVEAEEGFGGGVVVGVSGGADGGDGFGLGEAFGVGDGEVLDASVGVVDHAGGVLAL